MNRLHLSTQTYSGGWGEFGRPIEPFTDTPTPLCGASDGIATVRRGRGAGLVPNKAISAEFHCPSCVAIALSKEGKT